MKNQDPPEAAPDPNLPVFGIADSNFNGKLILAVHGMGDQFRNDFIQGVANLFAYHVAQGSPTGKKSPKPEKLENQTITLPLGAWDRGRETHIDDAAVYFCKRGSSEPLGGYAFAEIYWADVARGLEEEGHRIEDVPHWAGTVVERIGQRYGVNRKPGPEPLGRRVVNCIGRRDGKEGRLAPESLQLAAFVVEEIAETLGAIGMLASLKKLGGFSRRAFDQTILRSLGDVQQVAEYSRQREKIRLRFLNRLTWLFQRYPDVSEIHIIAHSEGAAISLFSLLSAMNADYGEGIARLQKAWADAGTGKARLDPAWFEEFWAREQQEREGLEEGEVAEKLSIRRNWLHERWSSLRQNNAADRALDLGWVQKCRSFTTIGSPIDKHLLLWPEMWRDFALKPKWVDLPKGQIRWRNYYDYADPVGYEHETARERLVGSGDIRANWGCEAFDFKKDDDHGFRRYPIAGKAHTDYFSDYKLFSHIVENSIEGRKVPELTPGSNAWGFIGRGLPFLFVLGLMAIAVLCFQRGLTGDLVPPGAEERAYRNAGAVLGLPADAFGKGKESTMDMLGVMKFTGIVGCTMLLAGTTVFARIFRLSNNRRMRFMALIIYLAGVGIYWFFPDYFSLEVVYPAGKLLGEKLGLPFTVSRLCQGIIIAVSLLAVFIGWGADHLSLARRQRPIWGLRLFIGGSSLLLLVTLLILRRGDGGNSSLGGVFGGWLMFTLVWWLSTLAFDLAFCWQRYINVKNSWLSVVRKAHRRECGPEEQGKQGHGTRPVNPPEDVEQSDPLEEMQAPEPPELPGGSGETTPA